MTASACVTWVDLCDAREGGDRVAQAVLVAQHETQDVMRVRRIGKGVRRDARLCLRQVEPCRVEKGDRQVQPGHGERGIDRERLPEGLLRRVVVELLQLRHAEVVQPIRGLVRFA